MVATAEPLPILPPPVAAIDDTFCGCGQPEHAWREVRRLLEAYERHEGWRHVGGHPARHVVAYLLDHLGLTEHGSSVGVAWLTDAGRVVLEFLRRHGEDWSERLAFVDAEGCHRGKIP